MYIFQRIKFEGIGKSSGSLGRKKQKTKVSESSLDFRNRKKGAGVIEHAEKIKDI